MPTTPIIESNNSTRRMFAYDEMVMASDGTRFYIKYLDGPANSKQAQPSQQRQSTTIMGRSATANSQLRQTLTSTLPSHTAAPPQVECGICKQKFKTLANLNFHIEKAHKDTDGPIDCLCGKRFANKKYMKRHQKRRYETERVICGRNPQPSSSATNINGVRLTYKNI